jgi:hypothetical protein
MSYELIPNFQQLFSAASCLLTQGKDIYIMLFHVYVYKSKLFTAIFQS